MIASAKAIVHFLKAGPKGEDGVGAYALDLDNENVGIGLTANGDGLYPAEGYNTAQSGIYVAGGASAMAALSMVEVLDSGGNVLCYATSGRVGSWSSSAMGITSLTLTISSISVVFDTDKARSSGERVEFKVRGTIAVNDAAGARSVTACKVMGIMFQPPGADGISPVVYELKPSTPCVVIAKDGTRSPAVATCRVKKHYGSEVAEISTAEGLEAEGLEVQSVSGGRTSSGLSRSVASATDLTWRLLKGGVKIDEEEIAFVRDGSDGSVGPVGPKGDNAVAFLATPSSIAYNPKSASTADIDVCFAVGETLSAPTYITISRGSTNWPQNTPYQGASWSAVAVGNALRITLAFAENATFEGQLAIATARAGKAYSALVSISRALDGSPGPAGLVYRKTEWAAEVEYHNDTALLGSQDLCYLDIVYKTDSNGQVTGIWECMETHTSSASNAPNGDATTQHWRPLNMMQPIYTSLILAQGSVIAFMQGNQLKIFDTEGNLKAGIQAASGAYPIFYANPQSYPESVTIALYTSSGTAEIPALDNRWVQETSVANGRYLHFRFVLRYSDGSVKTIMRFGRWQNQTGASATIKVSDLDITYLANASGDTSAGKCVMSADPCTSVNYPYLWVRIKGLPGDGEAGWFCIGQQSAGHSPTKAMWQQFDDGNATYGMPNGARIMLNAAPAEGLPRIDIYDERGNPCAHLDGTTIASQASLYGTGTSQATLSAAALTATSNPSATGLQTATEAREIELTCESDATITLPSGTIKAYGHSGNAGISIGGLVAMPQVRADLLVNGVVVGSAIHTFSGFDQSLSASNAASSAFPRQTLSVGPGTHRIALRAQYTGYAGGYAVAALDSDLICAIAGGRLMCRYFANGIAIGSATNNYFMAWNDPATNKMNFIVENPACGLKVTSNKVQIKRNGGNFVDL